MKGILDKKDALQMLIKLQFETFAMLRKCFMNFQVQLMKL